MKHELSTMALILLGGLLLVGGAIAVLTSDDLDEVCSENNTILYRSETEWVCGNLEDTVVNYTINNVTYFMNNDTLLFAGKGEDYYTPNNMTLSGDFHLTNGIMGVGAAPNALYQLRSMAGNGVNALRLDATDRRALQAVNTGGYTTMDVVQSGNNNGVAGSMFKSMVSANKATVHDAWQTGKSISDDVGDVGMGVGFRYSLENDNNENIVSSRHYSQWTSASDGNESADYVIETLDNGTMVESIRIKHEGLEIQPNFTGDFNDPPAVEFFGESGQVTGNNPMLRFWGFGSSYGGARYSDIYMDKWGKLTFAGTARSTTFNTFLHVNKLLSAEGFLLVGGYVFQLAANNYGSVKHPQYMTDVTAAQSAAHVFTTKDEGYKDFGVPPSLMPQIWMHDGSSNVSKISKIFHDGNTGVIDGDGGLNITGGNVYIEDDLVIGEDVSIGSYPLQTVTNGANNMIVVHEDAGTHDAGIRFRRGAGDWEIINRASGLIYEYEDNKIYNISTDGSVNAGGDMNILGNFTGNQIYGEGWADHAGVVSLASSGVYYNFTNFTTGEMNGFTLDGENFTTQVAGVYNINSFWSFSGTASNEYHLSIALNSVQQDKCHAERVIGTGRTF